MTEAEYQGAVNAISPTSNRWLCLDPGDTKTGWVLYCPRTERVLEAGWEDNARVLQHLDALDVWDLVVCELFEPRGMAIGQHSVDTIVWTGRFMERARCPFKTILRREVKLAICGSTRAKDGNIRQALIDLYVPVSQSKRPQGTKANPTPLTPLYSSAGASNHTYAALAVAHAWLTEHGSEG